LRSAVLAMRVLATAVLLCAVVILHHSNVEAAQDEAEVVSLDASELGESVHRHGPRLRMLGESVTAPKATIPQGSGSGSGSGSAAPPKVLKKPYHMHMKHNKELWQAKGGWTAVKESMISMAKAALKRATEYEKKKKGEKKVADMGCPCHGNKYYQYTWNPNRGVPSLGMRPKPMATTNAGSGSGSGKSKKSGCSPDPKVPCDNSPRYGLKAMLAKYGKIGPESSWTPAHEKQRGKAKSAVKIAEKDADAAFMTALPTFKKMAEDMPEFFTNGECKCPSWWTHADAAKLSAKMAKDKEDDLYKHKKMMWAQKKISSGEAAREKAAEEARIRAAQAAAKGAPPAKPAAAPAAAPAANTAPRAPAPVAGKPATLEKLLEDETEFALKTELGEGLK